MGDVHGLPELHGRGDRQEARSTRSASYIDARAAEREDRRRRRGRRRGRATSSSRRWSRRDDPGYRLLCEEIFGPVVTAHVYDDAKWEETLDDRGHDVAVRADRRGVRAATGARCAKRRWRCATRPETSTSTTSRRARWWDSSRSAARAASGTNDKAGSKLNLVRWVSARTIKENVLAADAIIAIPFMGAE